MSDAFEYDVFLSHAKKDKPAVRKLAERLEQDGLQVWFDEWVIHPGDLIPLAIERGLEGSRTLILVMSENTFASEWVTLERHTALFRDPANEQRRFIPLKLDDCEINDLLKQFAYVDWRNRDEKQYERLLLAVRARKETPTLSSKNWTVEQPKIRELHGHTRGVFGIAVTSDNKRLISCSTDRTLKVWSIESGDELATLTGHSGSVYTVSLIPNRNVAVSGSDDMTIKLWDLATNRCIASLSGHTAEVTALAVTADGMSIVSASEDKTIRVWNITSGECTRVINYAKKMGVVNFSQISVTPDGHTVICASNQSGLVGVWDLRSGEQIHLLVGHTDFVRATAVTPDGSRVVTSSKDKTIRVWSLQSGRCLGSLEGHKAQVFGLAISPDGTLVASGSYDRSMKLWDIETGTCLATYMRKSGTFYGVAFCGDDLLIGGHEHHSIVVWEPLVSLESKRRKDPQRYTNAKVLLVGDSGVGKSGLAIRLTEDKFEATVSTDAHWATRLQLPHDTNTNEIDREIWLWDFAGQADYRLIHQLFMDETALAVLVFNPQSENPFEGLRQWDRDLARAARRTFAKLLVAGRCDRGGLMVSRETIELFTRQRGFACYLETSALSGDGCESLRDEIVRRIDWNSIPWIASPRIFKLLKDEILRLRDEDIVLLRMSELKQQLEMRLVEESFTVEELRAVVGLLASPGLVWKLEFGDIVMLQPEWINKYAAAVIRSVRDHIGEIGVIDEAKVLSGELNYTIDIVRRESDGAEEAVKVEMQRLNPSNEVIVLRAMHQMFVDYGLCVREELESGGRQLIFPSYFKKELPTDPGHPPILVHYEFDGPAEEIYATLVVQLWRTKAFDNGELWRYAADFKSASGARLGLKMVRHEDKNPEISVYFDPSVQDDTRVTFIKYVHEHLLAKARDVVRLRAFVCPNCGHPVRDTELAREILNDKGANAKIRCLQPKCDRFFSLWDIIEQKFASKAFQERVQELEAQAKAAIDNESRELILEGHARVITGEAGQIYRGYTGSDHGIDGEIEFKDDLGQASGKRIYLQLKAGDSYLYQRKSDGAEIFQIKKQRWATYWREQAYPVLLVIRTSDEQIRWMNVTEYLAEESKGRKAPVKQIVFDGEPFTALNLQRMRDRICSRSNS